MIDIFHGKSAPEIFDKILLNRKETVDEENGWIQTLKIQFPTGTCPVVQGRNIYSRSCAAQENMIF